MQSSTTKIKNDNMKVVLAQSKKECKLENKSFFKLKTYSRVCSAVLFALIQLLYNYDLLDRSNEP